MFTTLIKVFFLLILLRIAWGVARGFHFFRRMDRGTPPGEKKEFDGTEIEDADWEEITDDEGKSP